MGGSSDTVRHDARTLEESAAHLAAILETAVDGIITIDGRGCIETFNAAAERIFGYRAAEVIGKNVALLMPAPESAEHSGYIQEFVDTGQARIIGLGREVTGRRRDGSTVALELAVSEVTVGGRRTFTGVVRDVSEQKRMMRALEERGRQQAAVTAFGQKALYGMPPDRLMEEGVKLVSRLLDMEFCKVLKLRPDRHSLVMVAGVGWQEGLVGKATVTAGPRTQAGFCLASNEPVIVENLHAETRFDPAPLLNDHGVVSSLCVVIYGREFRPVGILGAHTARQRTCSRDDVNFMQTVANVLGAAFERDEAQAALRRARDELESRVEQRTAELSDINNQLRREVVERRRVERKQQRLLDQLNHVNAELKDFAYIVSHDLKAPLRAISTLADWIRKDHGAALSEQGREYVDMMVNRVKRMNNLIEGILRYSRVGRVRPHREAVDSAAVAREVVQAINPPRHIAVTVSASLPRIVYDRVLLEQVFQNLIGNAVLHLGKPEGRVTVSCADAGPSWEFCVRDNGVGIERRHFERIFKVFQSLRPRDDVESTGIGLAVVKKIVEQSGGRVRLESAVGQGSAFFFTVPKGLEPTADEGRRA